MSSITISELKEIAEKAQVAIPLRGEIYADDHIRFITSVTPGTVKEVVDFAINQANQALILAEIIKRSGISEEEQNRIIEEINSEQNPDEGVQDTEG